MPADLTASQQGSPIQFLRSVSDSLGVPVWIKREDLYRIGGVGGSKARKLHHILASAKQARATDLVTIGTTGSHHVYAACALGEAQGLRVHAILLPQPNIPYANAVFNKTKAIGSNLLHAHNTASGILSLFRLNRLLKKQGRLPYIVFPGGSNPAGVRAYFDAGLELARDLRMLGENAQVDFQICVYGTGGITAGLAAAGRVSLLPLVYAVQVYPGFWNSKFYIRSLARLSQAPPKLTVRPRVSSAKRLLIDSSYIGGGYGTENPRCMEAVSIFEKDGIFLDPVYMARAAQAAVDLAKQVPKPRGLLLWYTAPGIEQ